METTRKWHVLAIVPLFIVLVPFLAAEELDISPIPLLATPAPIVLPDECRCWSAYMWYWDMQFDVYKADMDAVAHYETSGHTEGRPWNCSLCYENDTMYMNDTKCNCSDAAYIYINNHAANATNSTAFSQWRVEILSGNSPGWHCEKCVTTLLDPAIKDRERWYHLEQQCTCIEAGKDYLSRYQDVDEAYIDPIFHYENVGHAEGRDWGCSLCDHDPVFPDSPLCNCSAAQMEFVKHYYWFPTLLPSTAFAFWLLDGQDIGCKWLCEYCIPDVILNDLKLSAILGAFAVIGVILSLFSAGMLATNWRKFAKFGYLLCSLVIAGAFLGFTAAVTLLFDPPTDGLCLAYPWLLGIGFLLVYGCLFIKTLVAYRAWSRVAQYSVVGEENTVPHIPSLHILKIIIPALSAEIVYLVIWSAVDPPIVRLVEMSDGTFQHQCQSSSEVFWIIFLVANGLWLLVGAALAALSRGVVEGNESKNVTYSIYNTVAVVVIAGPLIALLRETESGGVLVIEVFGIVYVFTFTLVSSFFSIWAEIVLPIRAVHFDQDGSAMSATEDL